MRSWREYLPPLVAIKLPTERETMTDETISETQYRVMENDIFRVAVEEDWIPQERTKDTPGQDLFQHKETSYGLYQSILGFKDGRVPDLETAAQTTIEERLEAMKQDGSNVRMGDITNLERDWGTLAVADVIIDEQIYGMTVCYAFPEVMLFHWMTGPVDKNEDIKKEMVKIMSTVSYNKAK